MMKLVFLLSLFPVFTIAVYAQTRLDQGKTGKVKPDKTMSGNPIVQG